MAVSVVMPALEMAQETGKLVAWFKKEGEAVRKGELLIEVETDKAVVEIEAQGDGILAGLSANVGDVIPVGQTIAWLLQPGEAVPLPTGTSPTGRKMDSGPNPGAQEETIATAFSGGTAGAPAGTARISPKARRLAKEHGVELATIAGSGPGGEILADDILRAANVNTNEPNVQNESKPSNGSGLSTVGRIMADRTTQSWTTVPHFFVARDVDATALNAARTRLVAEVERSHGVKVTHTDLITLAVARALRKHPRMNSSWQNGTVLPNVAVNVALGIAVENAVVTAVIRATDRLTIGDLARQRKELSERARANKLQPADIAGATFTISNLGMFAVDAFTAIIVPPQAGILAVGAITDRVVAVDGQPAVRPMMTLTLSSDHRVVDGATAAQFLSDVVTNLESAGV